jgi:hypothetical protein
VERYKVRFAKVQNHENRISVKECSDLNVKYPLNDTEQQTNCDSQVTVEAFCFRFIISI